MLSAAMLTAGLAQTVVAWATPDSTPETVSTQEAVIEAISAGRDASDLLRSVDNRSGADIATRNTTGKQLAQALTAMAGAVNAGDIARIKQTYEYVRAGAILVQSDSQNLKTQLATDSSLPAAYEARRARVQTKLDQLLEQLAAGVAGLDGSVEQQAKALTALREALKVTSQMQGNAPMLRAALLPVRPLALAARAPVTSPAVAPSYEGSQDIAAAPEDVADAPEAPLNDEILAKTKELDYDYVRIYEYVRNNVRSEWYTGSVKGALGVLRSGAGNAVDQASLLIAMLRAAGAPARYVHGVVEINADDLANAAGLGDASLVSDLLTKAGIAFEPVIQGGRMVSVRVEHTWVAVQVPYTNYRGIVLDSTGKTWLPLDVFYKALLPRSSNVSLASLGLNWQNLTSQYRAAPQTLDFGAYLRDQVDTLLQTQTPASTYDSAAAPASIKPQTLGLLPNTLAFPVVAVTAESAALPDALQGTARIRVFNDAAGTGDAGLDVTLPVYELFNQRVTINYIPAELADHRAILLAGGLDLAPVYLFQLRPELRLDGFQRNVGLTPLDGGSNVKFRLDIQTPAGTQSVEQSFVVGAYHAIGVGQSGVTRSATPSPRDSEYTAARLLDGIVQRYEGQWSAFEAGVAPLSGAAIVHPTPSVTIVSNAMSAYSVNGVPYTLEWKGVTIDAAAHATEVTAPSAASARELLAAIGLTGSSLEHRVFETEFGTDSVSADKLMAEARAQSIDVLTLTSSNASRLASLPVPDASRAELQSFLQLGYSIETPAQSVAHNAWNGTGWIVSDPATGASGYYLSGGIAGGETTEYPWTNKFLEDALAAAHSDDPNDDPLSGSRVEIMGATTDLRGTVGQSFASQSFSVRVFDKQDRPVKGASVSFKTTRGGGSVFPATAVTDALGVASATVTLGTSTVTSPVYIQRNSSDTYATQVGLNIFDAEVASSTGVLKPSSPLTVYGLPDVPAILNTKQISETPPTPGIGTTSSMYSIEVLDQYSNPVANVSVKGVGLAATATCDPPVAALPATVDGPYDTTTYGLTFLTITPGPTNNTISPVQVSAGTLTKTIEIRVTTACTATPFVHALMWSYFDKDGNPAAATGTGNRFPKPFSLQLLKERASVGWNSAHVCVYMGTRSFEPIMSASAALQVSSGGSSLGLTPKGSGEWETYVLTGFAPARNDLTWNMSGTFTFDLKVSDDETCTSTPVELSFSESYPGGSVYGVRAAVSSISSANTEAGDDPNRVHLTATGENVYPIDIAFTLEPTEYVAPSVQMRLFEDDQLIDVRPSISKQEKGNVEIERGLHFDITKRYQVDEYVSDDIISEKVDLLSFKQLIVTQYNKKITLTRDVDIPDDRLCEKGEELDFTLSESAKITLKVTAYSDADGLALTGSAEVLIDAQPFNAGVNSIVLPPNALLPRKNGYKFELIAVSDSNGTSETHDGLIESKLELHDALPVGNILVNGVNVKSGQVLLSGMGIGVAARGPQLALHPAYASSDSGYIGALGLNWTHNYDASLKTTGCGDIIISAGDGGTVRFLPADNGTLTPAKGYHGALIASASDHSYDFYSKDGTRYHFGFVGGKRQWALQSIVDANGNGLTLTYATSSSDNDQDAQAQPLLRVSNDYGQSLQFVYQSRSFIDAVRGSFTLASLPVNVLQTVQGPDGMGLSFEYDDTGNLVKITRTDDPEVSESYTYSDNSGSLGVPNLLLSYTNALGKTTRFDYNASTILRTFSNGQISSLDSTVIGVTTPDGAKTSYAYNGNSDAPATDVTDAMGAITHYTFNKLGNPLTIDGPAGLTTMTWATDDVLMLSKTDANHVQTNYTYDANGNQTSEQVLGEGGATSSQTWLAQTSAPFIKSKLLGDTDRRGLTTTYSYDERGNLTGQKMPDASVISYVVAANGDRLSSTDALGSTTKMRYDGRGMRIAVVDALGSTTSTTYDTRGRQISAVDAEGHRTDMQYNTLDQLTQVISAVGTQVAGTRTMTWDALGNKLSETDEEGRATNYSYDDMSRVVRKNLPIGAAVKTTYNLLGSKTSETNLRGDVTTYDYDDANRLIRRTEPATPPKVTGYAYDGVGNITTETDALGRPTHYTYNVLNQRTATEYPDHTISRATYDGNGNKTSETDALGRVTTYTYDQLNRLINQIIAGQSKRSMTYDVNGNLISRTDANGNVTSFDYDELNRQIKETDALGRVTNTDYDRVGNKLQVTDALRHARKWQYNERNWVAVAQDGEGNQTKFTYDKVGNKLTENWPNSNTLNHGYDALNRLTGSSDDLGQLSAATYDADGNITSQSDGLGHSVTFTWDAIGRQLTRSQLTAAGNAVTTTTYDAAGNPVSVKSPNGNVTATEYDLRNRPVKVTDDLGIVSATTYDDVGNALTETDARGRVLTHTYNDFNLRTSTRDSLGQVSAVSYDLHGNKTSETDANGNLTTYAYDGLNRVTITTHAGIQIKKTAYDEVGNVQFETDARGNQIGYEYDKRNLLIKTNRSLGAIDQLARDSMGDVTLATDPENRTTRTQYDKRRRAISVTDGMGNLTQNTYDLAGNLTQVKAPNGATVNYNYDQANRLIGIDQSAP